jgi:predicted nucleotidyltransferase component of viral defense system
VSTIEPIFDILPSPQRALWADLNNVTANGFTLYGGTALALRLGHRSSVDFDFFSASPLDRAKLYSEVPILSTGQVVQDDGDTLTILVPSKAEFVKISFFGSIGFGRVDSPAFTSDNILEIASLLDIFATKVKVILQRAEAKDYRDIVALLKVGQSLSRGLGAAKALYGLQFQPSESLKALTYFEDGDLTTVTKPDRNTLITAAANVTDIDDVAIVSRDLSGAAVR